MLNKSKGNMYPWVTHTWNVIKGKCPHDCSYCYMKRYPQKGLHFDESELKTDLSAGNFIFVGSSCDDFALPVHSDWIKVMIWHCWKYPNNRYLFQSKACGRFNQFKFPPNTILGTTIESNRGYNGISKAPSPWERFMAMTYLDDYPHRMVSIEPIMDFDLQLFTDWIKQIRPEFVSIGADSGNNHLPEPSWDKIEALIKELQAFTEVKIKDNLKRLQRGLG